MGPFPEPEGVIVHQLWLLPAVHVLFDITENDVTPEDDETSWFAGAIESVNAFVVN